MIENDDAFDEDESFGPSQAYPPLYVLRTTDGCPECGERQHVYALGCTAFHDAQDAHPIEAFHFLRDVRRVPTSVLTILAAHCPSFRFDQIEDDETPLLINHCQCGAKLDDDFLHGDVGAAFWPDTPDGYAQLTLFQLPIEEPVPIVSSFAIGGGEYLDLANVVLW